jgi:radical SAM protein with 4Fe4S-binding SPASM domain
MTEVQVSATETSANKEELPHFIEYWKPRVNRVRIYARHSKHGKFGRLENGRFKVTNTLRYACRKPFTDFVICHDGRVALCNHDWQRPPENVLGSVRHMSIETIWHGATYAHIRQKHLSHRWDTLIPCGHCDHWINVDEDKSPIGQVIT